jgi:4-amino-4-deoxy-L-arabinose transferase-like glycosyltransferase
VALLLIVGIYLSFINPDLGDLAGDSAQYIFLAISLSQGRGYSSINYPGQPPHTKYPFVFPILLVPIIYFFGQNLTLMHLLIVLFAVLGLVLTFFYLGNILNRKWACLLSLLVAVSPVLVSSLGLILSDIPYFVFSLLFLICLERYATQESLLNRWFLSTCLFLLLAYFTRSVGISLFFACLSFLLARGLKRGSLGLSLKSTLYIGIVFLIPFFFWNWRNLHLDQSLGMGQDYWREFLLIDPNRPSLGKVGLKELFWRISLSGEFYGYEMAKTIFYQNEAIWNSYPGITAGLISSLIILGFLGCLIKRQGALEFYFFYYILTIFLWNFRDPRFLLPILPFVFYYFFQGLWFLERICLRQRKLSSRTNLAYLTFLLILVSNATGSVGQYVSFRQGRHYSLSAKNFIAACKWLDKNSPPEAIVISSKPSVTSFFSHRQAIGYPLSTHHKELISLIERLQIDYIIIDEFSPQTQMYLVPAIIEFSRRFRQVGNFGDTFLLEVLED